MTVTNSLQQMVTGTTAHRAGLKGVPVEGRQTLTFELPKLPLGAGEYTVSAAVFDGEYREIDRAESATSFSVHCDKASMGPLYTPARGGIAPRGDSEALRR